MRAALQIICLHTEITEQRDALHLLHIAHLYRHLCSITANVDEMTCLPSGGVGRIELDVCERAQQYPPPCGTTSLSRTVTQISV